MSNGFETLSDKYKRPKYGRTYAMYARRWMKSKSRLSSKYERNTSHTNNIIFKYNIIHLLSGVYTGYAYVRFFCQARIIRRTYTAHGHTLYTFNIIRCCIFVFYFHDELLTRLSPLSGRRFLYFGNTYSNALYT